MDLKESRLLRGGRHPWELARADFISSLLVDILRESSKCDVLDLGSGDGWLSSRLLKELPAGSNIDAVDAAYSHEQLFKLNDGSKQLRFFSSVPADKKYDVLFLFDVLEHVEDDRQFLREILLKHLSGGALVFVTVPAYARLMTSHDQWLGHYRRYSPRDARGLISSSGLQIISEGGLFHSLLYARLLGKIREQILGAKAENGVSNWMAKRTITSSIRCVLNLDWHASKLLSSMGIRIPGLSWWCVCRMP
jgi:SAM-dependent methyltransferase